MILDVLICSFCALLLYLVWRLRPQATLQPTLLEWDAAKLHINIDAFRLLVDKREELYLRKSLPGRRVRTILRKRAVVARQYLDAIERNALMLSKMASAAQSSTDPETARTAKELVRLILEVRLNIIVAIWCLRLKWLFPTWTPSLPTRLPAYDQVIDRGTRLLKSTRVLAPKPAGS